ncbi:MAG: hypothetical protein J5I47_13420 [Vicingus serpentipes]|nr:hypothetical protein [Vicingus serpentipes]
MSKEQKPFKETLFGKIVNKAANIIPDVAGVALQAATGDVKGAIDNLKGQLLHQSTTGNPQAKALLTELDIQMKQIELEFSRVELEETKAYLSDTQNARAREVEYVKMGRTDWMQVIVGVLGLIMLGFNLYAIVFLNIPADNKTLFTHFMGIIEGVALSIFGYYFGSSKGSKDKTNLLSK